MTVYEKLGLIQSALRAPKNQRNTFGNYNYRSCEDILEAVKPLLREYNCVVTLSDEVVEVGGRIYVKAHAALIDYDGMSVDEYAYAREAESKKGMDDSQITGATSSYARKYALNGLFAIDDNKDADATNTHGKEGEKTVESNVVHRCADCGNTILSYYVGGKTVEVEKHCAQSMKKFGKELCITCIRNNYADK